MRNYIDWEKVMGEMKGCMGREERIVTTPFEMACSAVKKSLQRVWPELRAAGGCAETVVKALREILGIGDDMKSYLRTFAHPDWTDEAIATFIDLRRLKQRGLMQGRPGMRRTRMAG